MKRWLLAPLLILSVLWFGPGALAQSGAGLTASGTSGVVGTVTVPAGTIHHGNVSVSAGILVVAGTVQGNVSVGMGQLEVSGHVTGSASVGMGQIILTHDGVISGNATVGMGQIQRLPPGQPLPQRSGAAPNGSSFVHMSGFPPFAWSSGGHWTLGGGLAKFAFLGWVAAFWGSLLWWLVSLAVALGLSAAYPKGLKRMEGQLLAGMGASLGWGALILLAAGPASILLALTIVGIPLVFLLWPALLAAKICGYTAAAMLVGRRILGRFSVAAPSLGLTLVVGTASFFLVGRIPVVGVLLDAAVLCAGVGLAALTGFGTGRRFFRRPSPEGSQSD